MSIDSGARQYYFEMPLFDGRRPIEVYFQSLSTQVGRIKTLSTVFPNDNPLERLLNYPALFSGGGGQVPPGVNLTRVIFRIVSRLDRRRIGTCYLKRKFYRL
jgi:hypothetical protein